MKKNFLTFAAVMVTAFFVAATAAQASDVTFSGQNLTRYEMNGQGDFNDNTDMNDAMQTRVRLNATVNVNDSTSAFISLQSTRTWGEDLTGIETGATSFGGSGNSSETVSSQDNSVGVYQAYFTLKNFASLPVDAKIGRQQIILDGHRLFGNTIWTMGMNPHDAIRLTNKSGNNTLNYIYIRANDDDTVVGDNSNNVSVHALHNNIQGILGGNLSLYGVATLDECGATANTTCGQAANDIYTVGFRQAGQLFGIDYRGEYYYQFGDARADATRNAGTLGHSSATLQPDIDREAYMFGVRVGKKFNNVMMKPSLAIWYDELSGTDDSDINNGTWGTFNTLYDTGHKFYGLMDLFLNKINGGTAGLGLEDIAVKGTLQPVPGWTVKAAYHWFSTEVDPSENGAARGPQVAASTDADIGTELDLSLHHKYNSNMVITAGYSIFEGEQLFNEQRQNAGDDAQWAYLQFHLKF